MANDSKSSFQTFKSTEQNVFFFRKREVFPEQVRTTDEVRSKPHAINNNEKKVTAR